MNIYRGPKTILEPDEVFVFGANLQGFHGAGSAGFATFNEFGNVWRKHGYDKLPNGTKGKWNIKGKLGPQEGLTGKSYALVTITKAGAKRSYIPNFKSLFECCRRNPSWKFFLSQNGEVGLNGWKPDEMARFLLGAGEIPQNLFLEESFATFVKKQINNE